jgi:hypothetical protein
LAAARVRTPVLRAVVLTLGLLFVLLLVPQVKQQLVAKRTPLSAPTIVPEPAPPAPAPIRGPITAGSGQLLLRVLDSQTGTPVANARLTSIRDTGFPNVQTNVLVTDSQGECVVSFDLDAEELWKLRVEILKDGYVPRFVSWAAERGDALEEIPSQYTTKLERGGVVGGSVISEAGELVPDVRIVVGGPGPATGTGAPAEREGLVVGHTETTDLQGHWMCNHVPSQLQVLSFTLSHPDYLSSTFRSVTLGASPDAAGNHLSEEAFRQRQAVMVLKPGQVVTGVVLDEQGRPVAGAQVIKNRLWEDPFSSQRTGGDGRFRFSDIPDGGLTLTVEADGFLATDKTLDAATQREEVRFSLTRASVFRGKAVDAGGRPIAMALVTADGGDFARGRFHWSTLTDQEGKVAWLSAPPQNLYFVQARGFETARLELPADGAEHQIALQKATKEPLRRIGGTVVDARTRKPVGQFQVWLATTLRQTDFSHATKYVGLAQELKTTGKDGRFSFLAPTRFGNPVDRYDVEIKAEGYLPQQQTVAGPLTNHCQLRFELAAVGTLDGTVRFPDGTAASGAVVMLCGSGLDPSGILSTAERTYMNASAQLDLRLSQGNYAETDAEGRFKLQTKALTGTLLAAHKLGFARMGLERLSRSPVITLQPWGCVCGVLKIGARPGAGKPVALSTIPFPYEEPMPCLQIHLATITDSEGHFAIAGVPPGEWQISPHDVRIQVEAGKTNELAIGGTGSRVVGRIQDGDSSQPFNQRGLAITLSSKWFDESPPQQEAFTSFEAFTRAKGEWLARRLAFQRSEAGRLALRTARQYSPVIQPDGTFAIDEVLPGTYELKIRGDPLRHDRLVMEALDNIRKEVIVPGDGESTGSVLDVGVLQLSTESR